VMEFKEKRNKDCSVKVTSFVVFVGLHVKMESLNW
jgi:hypothetical protein